MVHGACSDRRLGTRTTPTAARLLAGVSAQIPVTIPSTERMTSSTETKPMKLDFVLDLGFVGVDVGRAACGFICWYRTGDHEGVL